MRIVRWNPNQDLVSLREAMDRLFEESWVRPRQAGWREPEQARAWQLPIDVHSTDQEIVIQAAVAGLPAEAVEITIEGDTLTIRGEFPTRMENVSYLFDELPSGRFIRALNLNIPVDAARAAATFSNGLLTLVIPKAEAIKPRQIKVKTESSTWHGPDALESGPCLGTPCRSTNMSVTAAAGVSTYSSASTPPHSNVPGRSPPGASRGEPSGGALQGQGFRRHR